MKSIADQLPTEIATQIHPDRRKNEAAYWTVRDQLLGQYRGQWIGFADGRVVASGSSPVTVFHAAEATGLHPFFICVGREEEPSRIRRVAFPYDTSYAGEALPLIRVFSPIHERPRVEGLQLEPPLSIAETEELRKVKTSKRLNEILGRHGLP